MDISIKGIKRLETAEEQSSRRAEVLVFVPVIIAILIIASIPSIYAVVKTPEGAVWSGLISRNTNDINGYVSIIEEIRSDGLLAHNLMTAEPHPAFQFRPFHASLALLGKVFPTLRPIALLEIGRIIATIFLMFVILRVVSHFFQTTSNRIFAFIIIIFSSGLGWLHLINDPPDLRYSELSTFCSLISAPLYQFSLACVLAIILFISNAYRSDSRKHQLKHSVVAAVFAILLGLERPFSLITLGFAMIGFILIELRVNKRDALKLLKAGLLPAISATSVVLYQFYLIRTIPVYAEWNRQNILPAPALIPIFLSLGFLLPLAVFGFPQALKRNRVLTLILCCYAVSSLISSKLPFSVQERFLEGLPLSVSVLASVGAIRLKRFFRVPVIQAIFAVLLIGILIPSNVLAMKSDLQRLSDRSVPQYMPLTFMESLKVLKQVSKPGEAVLSLELAGNFIVAYSSRPAVIAHRIGTSRINDKKKMVTDLLELEAQNPAAKGLIRKANARWFFWGPEERHFSSGAFNPEKASYLLLVYRNKMVAIYKIDL